MTTREEFQDPILSTHVRHDRELWLSIAAQVYSHRVEFQIYVITSFEGRVEDGAPSWEAVDEAGNETENLEAATKLLSGHVKWDGCSNWNFDYQETGMMYHGCSRQNIQRIGDVMGQCWDWTAELLPNFIGD